MYWFKQYIKMPKHIELLQKLMFGIDKTYFIKQISETTSIELHPGDLLKTKEGIYVYIDNENGILYFALGKEETQEFTIKTYDTISFIKEWKEKKIALLSEELY